MKIPVFTLIAYASPGGNFSARYAAIQFAIFILKHMRQFSLR